MRFVEEYNIEKGYELQNGEKLSEEQMLALFPALGGGALIIVEGRTPIDSASYDYLLSKYYIEKPATIDEGLKLINNQLYFEQTESTPLERIAAALEFIELIMMEGK